MAWTKRDYRLYAEMTAKRASVTAIAYMLKKLPNTVSQMRRRRRLATKATA